jgi:hypothetical protein
MIKVFWQNYRRRKYRSGQTPATGFVATGFDQIRMEKG